MKGHGEMVWYQKQRDVLVSQSVEGGAHIEIKRGMFSPLPSFLPFVFTYRSVFIGIYLSGCLLFFARKKIPHASRALLGPINKDTWHMVSLAWYTEQ
jgi:hypothetical protein